MAAHERPLTVEVATKNRRKKTAATSGTMATATAEPEVETLDAASEPESEPESVPGPEVEAAPVVDAPSQNGGGAPDDDWGYTPMSEWGMDDSK